MLNMTDAKVDMMLALIRNRVIEDEAERFLELDVSGCDISARADRRIRRTIKYGRRRGHGGLTVLKRVAVAVALIMAMLFLMSSGLPEIREDYFLRFEGTPGKVGVSNGSNCLFVAFEIGLEHENEVGKLPAGEPSYIPEGYSLTRISESDDRNYEFIYENGDDKEIEVERRKVGVGYFYEGVDDYEYTAEEIKINGYSGVLITYPKDWRRQYFIKFCDGSYAYSFYVTDKDMTREELMRMAESVYE